MGLRSPQLYEALKRYCLGAFAYLYRESQSEAPLPFVVRGAPDARPAGALRVPAAGARLRRGARRAADAARRRAVRDRGAPPRARGGDLRARRTRARTRPPRAALFRTILLPFLSGMAEPCGGFDWDDGAFNRGYGELERVALRRAPLVRGGRAARRPLLLGCRSSSAAASACAWPRWGRSPPTGRRRTACSRRIRPRARARLRARARVRAPGRGGRAARCARRARRRRHRAPARDRARRSRPGPVAVRAARLAPVRRPAGAADRRDRAARRADAGSTRCAAGSPPTCSSGSRPPTATPGSARRSTAGSCRCSRPSRSGRSGCARRSPRCSAAATASGRRRCALSVLVGEDAARPRRARRAAARPRRGGGHATRRTADMVRRALVEVLLHGDRDAARRALDDSLLGLRPRPRATSRSTPSPASKPARSRHEPARLRRLPSEDGGGAARCWPGWSGSRRSTATARLPECCSRRCAACSTRRRHGRAPSRAGTDLAQSALERCREASTRRKPAAKARAGLW